MTTGDIRGRAADGGSMRLRIASFNVRRAKGLDGVNTWLLRRRLAADTIAYLQADVIGLQEVFQSQRNYLRRRLTGSSWVGRGRLGDRRDEQCPIAVLNPRFTVVEHRTMWFGDHPDVPGTRLPGAAFPRIATIARCRSVTDVAEFVVANTHLDEHRHDNRVGSVRQLVGTLDPELPTVVVGDFNATPDDHEVFAPLVAAGYRRAPLVGSTHHDFTGAVEGTQIDHVFASAHWSIDAADVVRTRRGPLLPSDHWPVRATLSC